MFFFLILFFFKMYNEEASTSNIFSKYKIFNCFFKVYNWKASTSQIFENVNCEMEHLNIFFFFFIENSFLNLHTTDISFKEPYNSKWKCVTFFSQWKCNPFPISLHDQLYNFAFSLELLRRESCLTVFYQMIYSAVVFTNMKPGSILMQVDLIKHTLADRWNKNT